MANVFLWGATLILPFVFALLPTNSFLILLAFLLFAFLCILFWAVFSLFLSYIVARRGPSPKPLPTPRLAFTTPAAWDRTLTRHKWDLSALTDHPPLHPNIPPPVDDAITGLISIIVANFVRSWHQEITGSHPAPSLAFPNAVESTIRFSLCRLIERAEKVDWPSLGVNKLLPKVTGHLAGYRSSQKSFSNRGGGGSDELDLLIARRYATETSPSSSLHAAVNVTSLNSRLSEEAWWRPKVEAILGLLMPENETKSEPVLVMAREIVVCAVIMPLVETLADPDFWNNLIDEKVRFERRKGCKLVFV
jgi:sorting nexin-25